MMRVRAASAHPEGILTGRQTAGFTLVELLVVVGIIAVLAALLLPVLSRGRGAALCSDCAARLRQLHGGFDLYAADHDGQLPPYQNNVGYMYFPTPDGQPQPLPEHGAELVAALQPYLRTHDVWFCPVDHLAHTDFVDHIRHRHASYAVGRSAMVDVVTGSVTMDGPIHPIEGMEPASRVLLTDCLWVYDAHVDPPPYSHHGWYNYLYFDGHVKSLIFR